jgi:hypothetical protein
VNDATLIVSACGVVLALLTFVVMSHRYQNDRIEAAKEQLRAELRSLAEGESKRRHDLAGHMQAEFGRLSAALARVDRESVRKEEMGAMEHRGTATLEKVTVKLDLLSDRLVSLAVLEKQVAGLEAKLDRVLDTRVGAG